MQYLSFEIILSSQHGDFRQIVGTVSNEQLVKAFLGLLVFWRFEANDPFLLVFVASHSGDFRFQTKTTVELEMLCIALQVFLHMAGGRV